MTLPVAGLTWALVIATKDRIEPLRSCVEHALSQSRPPAEVIIIDASANWRNHRDIIARLAAKSGIACIYQQAARPSAAFQRNQGIEAATADILFLIDDDSFLYSDAADQVLLLYEADSKNEVAGVQMEPAARPPGVVPEAFQQDRRGLETVAAVPGLKRRLLRQMLAYGLKGNFVPYDGKFPDRPVPFALRSFNVSPARLFEGFRMTLRRSVAARLLFEPLLLYYSPGEDLDLSYRASHEGALITARDAKVHHFVSGDGRLKRRQIELLSTLNQALFLRRNAVDQRSARARFIRWALHRAFAGLLLDLGQRRLDVPKARGCLAGLWLSRKVFRASPDMLEQIYPALQDRIVKG